jgi:hypothetical protein
MPLVVVAAIALCYAPYLTMGWGVLGFFTQGYLSEESLVSGEQIWPLAVWRRVAGIWSGDVIVYFAVGALFVAALALRAAFRSQRSDSIQLADLNALLLASLFVLSPNYPWYFLVVTPFVALSGGAPVWAMTLGAVLLQEEAGWGEFVPILIRKSVVYGGFIAACLYWLWQSRSAINASSAVTDAR